MKNAAAFQARTANFQNPQCRSIAGGRKTDRLNEGISRTKKRSDGLQAGCWIIAVHHAGIVIFRLVTDAGVTEANEDVEASAFGKKGCDSRIRPVGINHPEYQQEAKSRGKRTGKSRLEFKNCRKFDNQGVPETCLAARDISASPARMRAMTWSEK